MCAISLLALSSSSRACGVIDVVVCTQIANGVAPPLGAGVGASRSTQAPVWVNTEGIAKRIVGLLHVTVSRCHITQLKSIMQTTVIT